MESSIITYLINCVQRHGVHQDQALFEHYLKWTLTNIKMNMIDWITNENFSNLKYFNELINFYSVPTDGLFLTVLSLFMESVDKKTRFYIHILTVPKDTLCYLEESLNEPNPFKKLELAVKGYHLLITKLNEYNECVSPNKRIKR
jgi:hypothetical protein